MLAPMMAGEASMCFGLSEPGPGSDAAALATKAVPDGNAWRLTGRKIWTSNSPVADYCIVFAITDPGRAAARKGGISAFLVPTSSPGFEVQRIIKLFGHIGGDEAELRLEDVRVEPWQLVGELHQGFAARSTACRSADLQFGARRRVRPLGAREGARLRPAAQGLRQGDRRVPGRHLPAGRERHGTAWRAPDGPERRQPARPGAPAVKELAMAKAYSVQVGYKAVDRAMQTHGAMGFTNELGLHHAWHALRIVNVADGTNEILNRSIVQRLLKGDTEL
jgi:acyl-CoA dehydrogenase